MNQNHRGKQSLSYCVADCISLTHSLVSYEEFLVLIERYLVYKRREHYQMMQR